jgi:DME family drug/metabolite transporter
MPLLGYLAISSAAVLWALGGALGRFLLDRGASAVELTEARAWIAAAGTGLVVVLRNRRSGPRRRGSRPSIALVIAFGLSIAAANLAYYLAIALLPVAVAIVIQYTAPGLVVAYSALVTRRRPSGRVLAALGLTVAGVALVSQADRVLIKAGIAMPPAGLVAAAAASLAFAAYLVTGERLGRALGAERAVFEGFMVAGAFWVIVQAVRGRPDTLLDFDLLPAIAFLGIFTTLVPFSLFIWGLGYVEAARAGIISTLEPLIAAVIAFLWLGQTLTPLQVVGGLFVVVGIALVQWKQPPEPETLEERAILQ